MSLATLLVLTRVDGISQGFIFAISRGKYDMIKGTKFRDLSVLNLI